MVDYYDLILIAISAALVAGGAVSLVLPIGFYQGLAAGSLISTLLLFEVLFRNPPTEPTPSTTAASVVVGVGWLLTLVLAL